MKYKYNIETGPVRIKTNTRKYMAGVFSSIALVGVMAIPALAASNAYCGSSANGCAAAAAAEAQCGSGASSGSFGAFGKGNSLGTEKVHAEWLGSYPGPGTDGTQTGLNNSGVCGNRQGNNL